METCYAQIGGLAVATFITLLLVPVFYAIFVLDLKWIRWDAEHAPADAVPVPRLLPDDGGVTAA